MLADCCVAVPCASSCLARQVEHVKAEKQIMSMIEHPFIVNLLGAFQDALHVLGVVELRIA